MSQANTIPNTQQGDSLKMLRAMVGIGILCALLIVVTFEGTLPAIERNKAEALEQAIFKVVPGMEEKQNFKLDENGKLAPLEEGEETDDKIIYAGYNENGDLAGVAIEASGQGFADILRILYGYDPEKEAIVGFYVLESKETPGLGDKIEKDPAFLSNFDALDVSLTEEATQLKNNITPVKSGEKENPWEVDGITGATISSRAIGNILASSSEKWIPTIYQKRGQLEKGKTENDQ